MKYISAAAENMFSSVQGTFIKTRDPDRLWLNWFGVAVRKVAGLISGQGTCLGCGFVPHSGCMQELTDQFVSLVSFSLPDPLSKSK